MNKAASFHQPHLLRSLLAGVALVVNKKFHTRKPIKHEVGVYRLVNAILKEDSNFDIGIYSDGERKYFIKTWQGLLKDSDYYSLLNEYIVNPTVHGLLQKGKVLSGVTTPKVINCYHGHGSFSVVFEYIDGRSLDQFSADFQARILGKVLESFESITRELESKQRKIFAHRGALSYLVLLPILALLAIVHDFEEIPIILGCFWQCLRAFFHSYTSVLTLAHRDIGPDNILVADDGFYVVDLEQLALTYPLYDITSLGVEPSYRELIVMMKKNFMYVEDEFLRLFIFLRRAAFTGVK